MKENLKVYFIHSTKIDFNNEIYLPVLRSNYLSNHTLIFPNSEENMTKYYKDLIDSADLLVVNLTYSDTWLGMIVKDAVASKKPALYLARKDVGYEAKFQKFVSSVIAYSTEEEFRFFVEKFVKSYEGKIINGALDPTIVLGTLNQKTENE